MRCRRVDGDSKGNRVRCGTWRSPLPCDPQLGSEPGRALAARAGFVSHDQHGGACGRTRYRDQVDRILHSKARSICAAFLGCRPACRRAIRRFAWLFRIDANLKDLNRIRELAEFSPVFNTLTQGTHVAVTSVRSRGPRRGSRLEGRTGSGPARRDALLQDPTPISSTF